MALPVAPLGSMPNMQMPFSRQYYQEPQSTVDKALGAFLAGLAANVGSQLGENVMTRDYNQQMTGNPNAGIVSKAFQGPVMNRQQAESATARSVADRAREVEMRLAEEQMMRQDAARNRGYDLQTREGELDRQLRRDISASDRNLRLDQQVNQQIYDRESADRQMFEMMFGRQEQANNQAQLRRLDSELDVAGKKEILGYSSELEDAALQRRIAMMQGGAGRGAQPVSTIPSGTPMTKQEYDLIQQGLTPAQAKAMLSTPTGVRQPNAQSLQNSLPGQLGTTLGEKLSAEPTAMTPEMAAQIIQQYLARDPNSLRDLSQSRPF